MSDAPNHATKAGTSQPILVLVLGLLIGGAVVYSTLLTLGYQPPPKIPPTPSITPGAEGAAAGPGMGAPGPGAMMGGMGMGGGGPGGGGNRGKRNLTSFVGKLDLLTRSTLHVDLDADQSSKIAAKLEELEKAEKMTAEEAQSQLASLEELLTPEQKAVVDSIGLPFGGRPGGGQGGPPGGGMGGGGPGGGGSNDDNPFQQETNQKRLQDLLGRLKGSNAEAAAAPAP